MRIRTKKGVNANTAAQRGGKDAGNKSLLKPPWLKIRPPTTEKYRKIKTLLKQKNLYTVCTEANCPNAAECWSQGTATFMILGDTCTRACKFCNVISGNPKGKIDKDEPKKIVEAVKIMGIKYVVLTCVTRDDLKDGGAGHFANCIRAIKKYNPKILVEVLISDLNGSLDALEKIIKAKPDVLGHNVETVERLQKEVRDPRAGYKKSLKILKQAKKLAAGSKKNLSTSAPQLLTKSSLMLGLGETKQEVIKTMADLRKIQTDVITFGQYLQPSPYHLPVKKYITPAQFKQYENLAKKHGFLYCASGPFVRSSYKAGQYYIKNIWHS